MDGELAIRHIEAGGRPEDFGRPDRLTSLPDQCTDIAIDLLCERRGGVERLTLNTIARQANYTPSQFHGKVGGKAGMLEMIVGCFAERWTLMTTNPYGEFPALCWLPHTTDGLDAMRCWHDRDPGDGSRGPGPGAAPAAPTNAMPLADAHQTLSG